jgi:hypothetical protein
MTLNLYRFFISKVQLLIFIFEYILFVYYNYIIIVYDKFINFFLHCVIVWTDNSHTEERI